MSVVVFNRFVSLLALVAMSTAVLLAVPAVRNRVTGLPRLWAAWAVATVATLGSLAYSEIYGYEPCRLCWYQRIAMYPLVIVLGIAAWQKDGAVRRYILPPAIIGGLVAGYHYLLEWFPSLDAGVCSLGVPCSARYVNEFGFVSIPLMAFAGFSAIVALVSMKGDDDG